MDTLQLPFEVKRLSDRGDGTDFLGIASVYAIPDLVGDAVEKGAFSIDLEKRGAERPLLFQHRPAWVIGRAILTDSPQGLLVKGRLTKVTQIARDAAGLLNEGLLTGISI